MDDVYIINKGWLKVLHNESCAEDEAQKKYPVKLMEKKSRMAVWNMCSELGDATNGIPGLSCQMIERYFSKMFHLMSETLLSDHEIETFTELSTDKLPVLIAVIIKLVIKTTRNRDGRPINTILELLEKKKIVITVDYLREIEFEVFSKLEFHIPLWTNVDAGIYISKCLSVEMELLPSVGNIINYTEQNRDVIEKKALAKYAKLRLRGNETYILTLHIVAGAVAQAVDMVSLSNTDIMPHLAFLVCYSSVKLKCIMAAIASTLQI